MAGNVRAELGRVRMSQAAAAGHLKMSQTALSRRLNGAIAFNIDELEALANVLGVPIERLFTPAAVAAA